MREQGGDLWDRFGKSFLVVPTNIGYKKPDKKGRPGANVMGAGVALEATTRVPGIAQLYGEYCARFGAETGVTFDLSTGLVLFPTKPLNEDNPGMSWKSKSTIELVKKSAIQLAEMSWMTRESIASNCTSEEGARLEDDDVYLPCVGCGNGGLDESDVVPLLHDILTNDRFILMHFEPY